MQNKKQKSVYGIGVDICSVSRMREKLSRHGDKFAKKILTNSEYTLYCNSSNKAQYLAKCWAVKEAFVKALGTGFSGNFMWGDINYASPTKTYTNIRRPYVRLSERALYSSEMKNKNIHLSVSDEVENVIAFVTIEEEK